MPSPAGWLPIRPLNKTATTALVNWSGMPRHLHDAAAAHGYAPWGSGQVQYYAAWRAWRERRAGCTISTARAFSLWSRATRENPQFKRPTDDGPFECVPGDFTAIIANALSLPEDKLHQLIHQLSSQSVIALDGLITPTEASPHERLEGFGSHPRTVTVFHRRTGPYQPDLPASQAPQSSAS